MKVFNYDEVAKHGSRDDCYVILYNKVYDLTEFIPHHPGGAQVIIKHAGKDATSIFDPVHQAGTIEKFLPPEKFLGEVDTSTQPAELREEREAERRAEEERRKKIPPLGQCLNLRDFEVVAREIMSPLAWAYYSSAADDNESYNENLNAFRRIYFRPRILRDVSRVEPQARLLSHRSSLPVYITATALGRLGHPDGEKNLTIAAARQGLIQMVPTLSSCSMEEVVGARDAEGRPTQFFQLYVNADRKVVLDMVRRAENLGMQALFVTVDAPQLGRRERDMRMHFDDQGSHVQGGTDVNRDEGAARAISSFIDPSLNWNDIVWLRTITRLPIVLKGVQTWEDCVQAAEMGLAGVVLSNHGGRQLDFARSGVEVLEECVTALKQRGLFPKPWFQLFVDGGIRRGTDVLKCVALGATAVGIGRPFLYAYSAYGPAGVERGIQLLRDEIEMCMRLIGAPTLRDLVPEMLDLRALHTHGMGARPDDGSNALNPSGHSKL